MAIDAILDAMVDVYKSHFVKASDNYIKRVTATVPESVDEWPWLYFVCDAGDVELMTFSDDLDETPQRRTFGKPTTTVRRPKLTVTHRFKAQLLVRPRRDLAEDETQVRPFIEPIILVTTENIELGGLVKYVKPTGYKYGMMAMGRVAEKPIEYIGVEFFYEAKEIV